MDSAFEHHIPILVITGPTASGKTSLAISLARELGAELVGADSMQVYRHMDIGTDTPTPEELGEVAHHLINVVNPDEAFDTARYSREADAAISAIHGRGHRVIVVGGTGLYIRNLLTGLQPGPAPDPALRRTLTDQAAAEGWPSLHRQLARCDPEAASRLHPNDGVRIVRALEVFEQTGVPLSRWQRDHGFKQQRYPFRMIAIERPVEELNQKINARVDQMMDAGFLNEVRALLEMGYGPDLKPMQALGYKHLCDHLRNALPLDEAIEKIKTDTRRFSKRQRTWLRGEKSAEFTPPNLDVLRAAAQSFFADY